MKKHLKRKGRPVPARHEPDTSDIIVRIEQRMVFLENKLDTLIGRVTETTFTREGNQKPYQRPDQIQHHGEARPANNYRERVLHKAICADCNKECEVPFRPSGDRPVYCKDCFSKRKAGSSFKPNREFHKERGGEDRKSAERKKRLPGKRKKRA